VTGLLSAHAVRVGTPPRELLPATTLELRAGRVQVAVGAPGHGHTALALALAGRLGLDGGSVDLDGDTTPAVLQRAVALVDVPGVSEPDGSLPVRTVVGEELAFAGLPASRGDVRAWLAERDLQPLLARRFEDVPAADRTRILAELAARRPGVRFLVAPLPERHGRGPAAWAGEAERLAATGIGVLITATHVAAGTLTGLDDMRFIGDEERP
jgi:ABC-type cobalamin/Fe3+-siderophores transport system ATPase subunit